MLQYTSNLYLHHSNPLNLHNLYTFSSLSFSLWHQAPFIHRSPNLQGFNTTRKPTTPTRRERNGACTCVLIRCSSARGERVTVPRPRYIYARTYARCYRERREAIVKPCVLWHRPRAYIRATSRAAEALTREASWPPRQRERERETEKSPLYIAGVCTRLGYSGNTWQLPRWTSFSIRRAPVVLGLHEGVLGIKVLGLAKVHCIVDVAFYLILQVLNLRKKMRKMVMKINLPRNRLIHCCSIEKDNSTLFFI